MNKVKKILFPTDFSETSQNAFRHCILFANYYEADIELLHVIFPEYEALDLPVMAAQATKEKAEVARSLMKAFTENALVQVQAAQELDSLGVIRPEIEIGTPASIISERARRTQADLIVMGTKGEHNVLERLFGSVTTGVIEKAHCHVLVIPEEAAISKLHIVAYASDLQEADPYHIWEAGKLLEPFSPIIHCVHVNIEPSVGRALDFASLRAFFEHHAPALQINFHPLPKQRVVAALEEFVDLHDVDLLAMYAPQHNWLDRLFRKSHTRSMAFVTRIPLLLLKK